MRLESMSPTLSATTSDDAQTGAVGDAERRLVLRPGRGLEQPQRPPRRKHRAAACAARATTRRWREVGRSSVTVKKKRNAETVVLMLGGCIPLSVCAAGSGGCRRRRGIGGAAEKAAKRLDLPDIVVLRLVAEACARHVLDHAAAQRADGLVGHRGLLS